MYCGIDLGSTNIKIAIYDRDFNLIDRQSRPVEYIRDNGFVEFDAERYARELRELLATMVKENDLSGKAHIALTGQAESLVVLGRDGKPLMNAISWMDERSVEECAILSKHFSWSGAATVCCSCPIWWVPTLRSLTPMLPACSGDCGRSTTNSTWPMR